MSNVDGCVILIGRPPKTSRRTSRVWVHLTSLVKWTHTLDDIFNCPGLKRFFTVHVWRKFIHQESTFAGLERENETAPQSMFVLIHPLPRKVADEYVY